jgi:hypothetical protein
MEGMMDNFLTSLYKKYFNAIEEEKKHRAIHDFDSEASNARNDEKIVSAQVRTKLVKDLIIEYVNIRKD